MEREKSVSSSTIVIILVLGLCLVGFATWYGINNLKESNPKETSSFIDEIETVENTKKLTDSQARAYMSLVTLDKSYGFYFNKDLSIEKISDYNMIEYALDNYVKENNISLDSDLSCLEFETEYCKDVTFPSVKSEKIEKYIKEKFNTSRAFELTPDNLPNQYIDSEEYIVMPIHGGFCNYNFSEKTYYFGTIATGGMFRRIHTKLYKTEEDGNNIYFYDKAFIEEFSQGYISLTKYLLGETSENDNEFFSFDTEDNKKYDEIKLIKENGNNTYNVDVDYIFEKYGAKLNMYKHTFKKVKNNYYWVSSELVK